MIANDNMKSYIYKIRIYFLILIAFIYHSIAYSPELNIQYAEDLQSNLKKNFVKYDNKNYNKFFIDKDTCIYVNDNSYELINDNDECIEFSSKFIKAEFSPTGVNDEEYLIIFRKKKGSDEVSYSYNNVDWYDIKPEKIIPEEKNKYNEFVDIVNKSWQRRLFQYIYYSHTENPEIFVTPISCYNDNVYRYKSYEYYLDTLEEDYAEYPYYKLHINCKFLRHDGIEFTKYYRYDSDKNKVEVSEDNYKWNEVQITKNYREDMDG